MYSLGIFMLIMGVVGYFYWGIERDFKKLLRKKVNPDIPLFFNEEFKYIFERPFYRHFGIYQIKYLQLIFRKYKDISLEKAAKPVRIYNILAIILYTIFYVCIYIETNVSK